MLKLRSWSLYDQLFELVFDESRRSLIARMENWNSMELLKGQILSNKTNENVVINLDFSGRW